MNLDFLIRLKNAYASALELADNYNGGRDIKGLMDDDEAPEEYIELCDLINTLSNV